MIGKTLAAGLAAALLSGAALAGPTQQWLIGAETAGVASYAYLGHVSPLPGGDFGAGWVKRFWLDWSEYRYDKGGVEIKAKSPGVDAALGYQKADAGGWWAAYLGAAYRDTQLSPDDPDSDARGRRVRAKLQLEGEVNLENEWRIAGIAGYIAGQDGYWTRVRALRGALGGWRLGGEATLQGDPSYRAAQLGAVVVLPRTTGGWDVAFKLGGRRVEGLDARAYFGIEVGGFF